MNEQWLDIAGFPGYQVSNLGRVRTHNKITSSKRFAKRKWKDRILKPKVGKDCCLRIELWNGNNHKTVLVHRLVASAFLGESLDTKLTVNHKDGNRLNNRVDNLEWLTLADNIRHGFKTGLYHTQKECVISVNNIKRTFQSLSEASRFIGRNCGYISGQIKSGKCVKTVEGLPVEVIV